MKSRSNGMVMERAMTTHSWSHFGDLEVLLWDVESTLWGAADGSLANATIFLGPRPEGVMLGRGREEGAVRIVRLKAVSCIKLSASWIMCRKRYRKSRADYNVFKEMDPCVGHCLKPWTACRLQSKKMCYSCIYVGFRTFCAC